MNLKIRTYRITAILDRPGQGDHQALHSNNDNFQVREIVNGIAPKLSLNFLRNLR